MSEFTEHVTYINLDKRCDRREEMEQQLKEYNLIGQRFAAIETSGFGIHGCGLSHLAVLKNAREKGYKHILILEDDFVFLVDKPTFDNEMQTLFNSKIDFDVCMLSYLLLDSEESEDFPFLYKIKEAQTASGYIVNHTYYNKLINLYEDAMPKLIKTQQHWIYANDQCWKPMQQEDKWYCFKNRIGKQRDGYSDNAKSYMNYNC